MGAHDWMKHSLDLIREKCKPKHIHEWDDEAALQRELKLCEFVMANLKDAQQLLHGSARVWWRFMVGHARLQVKRYAREIDDAEFYEACRELRDWRDLVDEEVKNQAWMRRQGEKAG